MDKDLLSVRQAAEILGVTPARVRQICGAGDLGFKIDTRWAIPRAELDAFKAIPRRAGRPVAVEEGESDGDH